MVKSFTTDAAAYNDFNQTTHNDQFEITAQYDVKITNIVCIWCAGFHKYMDMRVAVINDYVNGGLVVIGAWSFLTANPFFKSIKSFMR